MRQRFSENRNPEEAEAITFLLQSLVSEYRTFDFRSRITIISPYQEQLSTFRDALQRSQLAADVKESIELSAVDAMQGKENDIIFVSTVRSGNDSPGFIDDQRLVNVALSRAKYSLVVVGDTHLWRVNAWSVNLFSTSTKKQIE